MTDSNDELHRPTLCVALFGEPRVSCRDGSTFRVISQKAALLLAYLAHFNNRHHSREQLAEVLWPDSDGDSTRARLRNVLSELRRVLEAAGVDPNSVIIATRTSIEFNPGSVDTDVTRFECLLEQARTQNPDSAVTFNRQAVEISASEFCSTLYDDWVTVERIRLLNLRHQALSRLASTLLDLRRLTEAEEAARILIRGEPVSDIAHDIIIAVRIARGDYAGARRQYSALEQILRSELGTEPSDHSHNLIASIPASSPRQLTKVDPPQPAPHHA